MQSLRADKHSGTVLGPGSLTVVRAKRVKTSTVRDVWMQAGTQTKEQNIRNVRGYKPGKDTEADG